MSNSTFSAFSALSEQQLSWMEGPETSPFRGGSENYAKFALNTDQFIALQKLVFDGTVKLTGVEIECADYFVRCCKELHQEASEYEEEYGYCLPMGHCSFGIFEAVEAGRYYWYETTSGTILSAGFGAEEEPLFEVFLPTEREGGYIWKILFALTSLGWSEERVDSCLNSHRLSPVQRCELQTDIDLWHGDGGGKLWEYEERVCELYDSFSEKEKKEYNIKKKDLYRACKPCDWGSKENGNDGEGGPGEWGSEWWVETAIHQPGELMEYPQIIYCQCSNEPGCITAKTYKAL